MAERAQHKASRILQIEELLLTHPEGLTQAEIARRLNVHRSTIHRDLADLDQHFAVYEGEDGRIAIDRESYLTDVRFTLHEAMAVHLASRLMAMSTDKHNPHAAAVLRKLARSLEGLAPRISDHVRASAEVMDADAQRHDPVYLQVLETLTRAWSLGRKVRLTHQMPDQRVHTYTFSPYYIEPYPAGRTSHVIGWREPPKAVRTFKIERIRTVELLDEAYTIPADFDARETLRDAWGIWYTDDPPVDIVLRFHPRVAGRVMETCWHASEAKSVAEDGSVHYRARIAEPREMLPWIRGWGADVEVLEPEGLRVALEREARRMAQLYHVATIEPPPLYQLLWAKTDQTHRTDRTHALIYHMLDVAQVTAALWDHALPDATRRSFAEALDMEPQAARQWLAFATGLHDLGKACPAFQCRHEPSRALLAQAGLSFPSLGSQQSTPHGLVTTQALRTILPEMGFERAVALSLAYTLGGHHGVFPTASAVQALGPSQRGGVDWETARRALFDALAAQLDVASLPAWPRSLSPKHPMWSQLAGLTSFADWMGSIEDYFFDLDAPTLSTYAARAYGHAITALRQLGWTSYTPPDAPATFGALFGFEPRPLQDAVIDLAEHVTSPALVIVEAPTGEGKTEAALYLADRWVTAHRQRGIYVAMPTQATSNQMLGRVRQFLERRYGGQHVDLLLLHGNAAWSKELETLQLAAIDEGTESTVVAHSWFLQNKKRGLLAPFAVGTVDQALLSVLQTKHFFVRLFGLSHKTVVFDEVHAYDAYMSTLLERLLGWLAALGTTVVLLSATLPADTRRRLIKAYTGHETCSEASYPAITWATPEAQGTIPITTSATSTRTLDIAWIPRDPEALVTTLRDALGDGGCVAIVCNTVSRAQAVFRALREAHLVPDNDLILFHARFPFGQRAAIEERVLAMLGPDGTTRPERAIVIATQVIEQSLDLDFDLMVSDLAPIDLLLQRAGRLHRHYRATRPARLASPRLVITAPELRDTLPAWGSDALVYESYVLLRTYLTLQPRQTLSVPEDTPGLIAAVYDPPDALPPVADKAIAAALADAYDRMVIREGRDDFQAQKNLVGSPRSEIWATDNRQLDEDNPELHTTWRALTRLAPPSVTLVCLHLHPDGQVSLDEAGQLPVNLEARPDSEATAALMERTVSVSQSGIVRYFLDQEPPIGWQRHGALRYYRVALFDGRRCDAGTHDLILDDHEGLLIEKKEA